MFLLKSELKLIAFEDIISNINFNMFLLIQALFMVLFFIAIFTRNNSLYNSKLVKITDNIWIPQKAGQGQYGTSRFLTKKEFNKKYPKFTVDKTKKEV